MSEKKYAAFCVYCGEEQSFPTIEERNETMVAHVVDCERNPLVRIIASREAEIARLKGEVAERDKWIGLAMASLAALTKGREHYEKVMAHLAKASGHAPRDKDREKVEGR
jgi:hypothetical protein